MNQSQNNGEVGQYNEEEASRKKKIKDHGVHELPITLVENRN
jgi:hypothetical protein